MKRMKTICEAEGLQVRRANVLPGSQSALASSSSPLSSLLH